MRGSSQTEREILAVVPPLGTGTDLPSRISSVSRMLGAPERGAMTFTWCPAFMRCWPKWDMWAITPPG